MKPRNIYKGISLARFNKSFQNDEDCYKYLAGIKWKGDSFVCKRCGNTHYCKGQLPFARRCTRCKHDESPTAGTIFNKIRISLLTAFRIIFDMCVSEKSISSSKQAEDINFLNGTVLITDFYVVGRNNEQSENIVLVAMEVLNNGEIGKAYGLLLNCLSS